jgi:peptidoglycan/xylan/chitin deacetylase (PgdA/CDA1 family)
MIAEGHEVGNHTMTHRRLDSLDPLDVRRELAGCAATIRQAAGRDVTLFRPPGMRSNSMVLDVARRQGYTTIDWTTGAKDFTGSNGIRDQVEPQPELIAQRVLSNVSNGSIVLLHDAPATAKAMPAIIRGLRAQGYQIISVSQMLASLPRPVFVAANPLSRVALAKKKSKPKAKKARGWVRQRKSTPIDPRKLQEFGEEQYLQEWALLDV